MPSKLSVFWVAMGRLSKEPSGLAVVIMVMRMSLMSSPIFLRPSSPLRCFCSGMRTSNVLDAGWGLWGRGEVGAG